MMNSISLTNEELAVLPQASVCEAPNEFSNGYVITGYVFDEFAD